MSHLTLVSDNTDDQRAEYIWRLRDIQIKIDQRLSKKWSYKRLRAIQAKTANGGYKKLPADITSRDLELLSLRVRLIKKASYQRAPLSVAYSQVPTGLDILRRNVSGFKSREARHDKHRTKRIRGVN